ncbi:MAG: pyridoxamine 5'-phosphate oxidase [Gloeomargaritaceae cyanobacterium C42_A2020_066]|nr:pyridoxamine 5'-phosphate oxidase [Gloeomargaritaceae cyanobacterium C42_A2020_066]
MILHVANLRHNYSREGFLEADALPDPLAQFRLWFEQALEAGVPEPNAMTLATVDHYGRPAGRIVLLKGLDERGFVFYTNYESAKGQQLQQTPYAALVFWWAELERQVRITGSVDRVSAAETEAYFHSRPRASQLGAWASPQSQPLPDRASLDQRYQALEARYADQVIPRPLHWGGFRVMPDTLEFWQGRPSRLHDRLCYIRQGDGQWLRQRLAP